MTVLRTFVLNSPEKGADMVGFVKQHGSEAVKRGQPLQVTVALYSPKPHEGARRFMWGHVVDPIATQVRVNGQWFAPEVWHELFKAMFLPERSASGKDKWTVYPDGRRELAMGTGDLNEQETDLYLMQVQAFAATELGVVFDANE